MSFSNKGDFGDNGDEGYQVPLTPLVLAPPSDPGSEATATSPTPGGDTPPNPSEQYSRYYTLADLTVTSLPYPNLPLDTASQSNLRRLAELFDVIRDKVGDFAIASAYRSPENQAALRSGAGGETAASMAVKASYHSQGLGADLTPKNGMTPSQFAAALYTTPEVNALIGQITDKSEGGGETSLHISLQTPRFPKATLMYVGDDKQYYRMTASEVQSFLKSFSEKIVGAIEENPEAAAGVGAGTLALLATGGYFFYQYMKKNR